MKKTILLIALLLIGSVSLVSGEEQWNERRTRHFYIYYKDVPNDFLQGVEESAERYYDDITRNLGFTRYKGWSFDERAQIYIYRDRQDFISSGGAKWAGGAASAYSKTIRTFPAAAGFFDSTLPHELGHIIFREFIGNYVDVPLWFEEGIASFQEQAKRWGAHREVKEAIANGTFIPLPELSHVKLTQGVSQQMVSLFYAESASIVYYLITEQGQHRFVEFCRKLKSLNSFERALTSAYSRFDSLEDLNRSWKSYLEMQ